MISLREIARNVAMFQNTLACNFNCEYCLAKASNRSKGSKPPYAIQQLIHLFNNTGKKWWFVISGGESFLYPNFSDLLENITKEGHWVSVDTNLSQNISDVIKRTDPNRVVMFSCAYHQRTEYSKERKSMFIRRIRDLAENGYRVTIPYVMHPRRFDDYEIAKQDFNEIGFRITPQPFRGRYHFKQYPQAYSKKQRTKIFEDQPRPLLFTLPSYNGKVCKAGYELIRILPDGSIHRCPDHPIKIGDISDGYLDLHSKPIPCDMKKCACNRFIRQVDKLPDLKSMIDSFEHDITINEARITYP